MHLYKALLMFLKNRRSFWILNLISPSYYSGGCGTERVNQCEEKRHKLLRSPYLLFSIVISEDPSNKLSKFMISENKFNSGRGTERVNVN